MRTEHAQRVYFEQLKRTVPISAVLQKYGIELKRRGNTLTGCCPIHNGSNPRQFSVDENKGLWHCFGNCQRGGDVINLVAELEKIEIREAALLIARWFAISSGTTINQQPQQRRRVMSDASKQPTHYLYSAKRREGAEKDDLTRIGSMWPFEYEQNGKKRSGLNIVLSAMPISDRMVAFERDAEWEAEQQAKREGANGNGGKPLAKKK